jgi:hypothetical protein
VWAERDRRVNERERRAEEAENANAERSELNILNSRAQVQTGTSRFSGLLVVGETCKGRAEVGVMMVVDDVVLQHRPTTKKGGDRTQAQILGKLELEPGTSNYHRPKLSRARRTHTHK